MTTLSRVYIEKYLEPVVRYYRGRCYTSRRRREQPSCSAKVTYIEAQNVTKVYRVIRTKKYTTCTEFLL